MRRVTQIFLTVGVSLVTFVLGAAIAEFYHRDVHRNHPTAWETLLSFENQDLANLKPDANESLQTAIDALTGPLESKAFPYEPRLFRAMSNANGEMRYILVEERPLIIIPSESRLRVHIFDTAGQILTGTDFSAGWRTVLTARRNAYSIQMAIDDLRNRTNRWTGARGAWFAT